MHFQFMLHPSLEPTLAHDNELVQRVVARLRSRIGDQIRGFQLLVHEDGLVLRGVVRTYYGKQMAQEVAMDVSGRLILANDIEVRSRNVI